MKIYTVEWSGKDLDTRTHDYMANNAQAAYSQATQEHSYTEYNLVTVYAGIKLFPNKFENPHHPNSEVQSQESKLTAKQESRGGASLAPAEQGQTADLTGIQFVPFTPSVKLGFKDMGGIATQLNKAVSAFEAKGYEFLRIDTIHVDIRPGCIMALFGKQTEYHPYEFLVFRKIDS